MNKKYIQTGMAALLAGTLLFPNGLIVEAASEQASVTAAPSVNYGLTEQIRAAVKSASLTPTELGAQVSATIRLYNGGEAQTRIPEHELRVRTRSGVTYTLTASAANKTALQPKEIAELVYLADIDSKEMDEIAQFEFVNVNLYTYPKTETRLLAIPAGAVWYGIGESSTITSEKLGWGQSFRIPGVNSGIVYTPTDATIQHTDGGNAAVVTVLADNPGLGRETVPAFRIDAAAGQKIYEGKPSESDPKTLEAGEQAYLHFIIPLEQNVTLSDLLVVSTDNFISSNGGSIVTVATGKLIFAWPGGNRAHAAMPGYSLGQPIRFDSLSKVVDQQTDVSLVDFQVHDNPEEGYKTAVAKFKLHNHSDQPLPLPSFGAEIMNSNGISYRGSRQANTTTMMNPGLSYVVNYAFVLPKTEEETRFTMKLLDLVAASPYSTTAASLAVSKPEEVEDQAFALYPFEIGINDVQVGFLYNAGAYLFKVTVDMSIEQADDVVVDQGFSKLRFEIIDSVGRIIGTQDAALTGPGKLISGKQVLESNNLRSEQFNYPYTVNLYEIIETENGAAKRFLKRIK